LGGENGRQDGRKERGEGMGIERRESEVGRENEK
jgi:hypothetical protein